MPNQRHSRCCHGTILRDSWQDCSKCWDAHIRDKETWTAQDWTRRRELFPEEFSQQHHEESPSKVEIGTVKFFDNRDNKRFGFITVEGGGEIFFHFNDGENAEGSKLEVEPKKGDTVVFRRKTSGKGPKAAPWGFKGDVPAVAR